MRPRPPAWMALIAVIILAGAGGLAATRNPTGWAPAVPQVIKHLLTAFIEPGLTTWWFVLGGPFQSTPSTDAGQIFAVTSNTLLWLLPIAFLLWGSNRCQRRQSSSTPTRPDEP